MSTFLRLLAALTSSAYAAELQNRGSENDGVSQMWEMICSTLPFCSLGASTAPGFFAGRIIAVVQSLVTAVAVMMILYASILMSTSQIGEDRVSQAKRIILYACVGIVLTIVANAFLSYLILTVFPQLFQ